jgi:hypothetical protein
VGVDFAMLQKMRISFCGSQDIEEGSAISIRLTFPKISPAAESHAAKALTPIGRFGEDDPSETIERAMTGLEDG